MKVIIAGASGFIGRNLTLSVPESWDVTALFNTSKDFPAFVKHQCRTNVSVMQCDLTQTKDIQVLKDRAGSEYDLCIYLAANGDPAFSVKEPETDLKHNTLSVVHLLKAIRGRRFIYFSSGAVYEGLNGAVSPQTPVHPTLPYAISKVASEQYVKFFAQRGTIGEYVIVRFFGAYGPYEPPRKIYTKLLRALYLEDKHEFTLRGDGKNFIDAMYVDDAIDGILAAAESRTRDVTVDFCSGNAVTMDELVHTVARVFNNKSVMIHHEGTVPEYIRFRASTDGMQRLFSFTPRLSLEEGLRRFGEFLCREGGSTPSRVREQKQKAHT